MPCQYATGPARASPAQSYQPDAAVHVRGGPYSRAAARIVTRSDAPVVRNLRRGTTADALAALRDAGITALIEDLLQERYARSAATLSASLLKTGAYFHEEAFGHDANDTGSSILMFPVTVRSLVVIGAL